MSAVVGSSTRTSLGAAHGAAPLHFVSSEGLVTQCTKGERGGERERERERERKKESERAQNVITQG